MILAVNHLTTTQHKPMKMCLVRDRQAGGKVHGLFKKFTSAKKLKAQLMKAGINTGVDEVETDLVEE